MEGNEMKKGAYKFLLANLIIGLLPSTGLYFMLNSLLVWWQCLGFVFVFLTYYAVNNSNIDYLEDEINNLKNQSK